MWVILLVFFVGFLSGRNVDLARSPRHLVVGVLSLIPGTAMFAKSELDPGGCAGGTCIADGFFLIATLGLAIGALGYLAGGAICSLANPETASPRTVATMKFVKWMIIGMTAAAIPAAILLNLLSAGAALSR